MARPDGHAPTARTALPDGSWQLVVGARQPPDHLVPQATADVGTEEADGAVRTWHSRGDRSVIGLARADGAPRPVVPAGWYRLRGWVEAIDGAWVAPQFNLRYRDQPEPLPVALRLPEPDAAGRIDTPLLFDHDVIELGLAPSVLPCAFRMHGFVLERMGRLQWPARLIAELKTRDGHRDWRAIAVAMGASLSRLLRGDLAGVGQAVAASYHDAHRKHARSYELWAARYDTFLPSTLDAMAERGRVLAAQGPLVSILLPVYETPAPWLRRCLDSVLAQAYPRWELCVADDASRQPHVREILAAYAQADARIRVVHRPANGHIVAASNTALEMAQGSYVALLDHDDELRPHALLEMVEAVCADPRRQVLYSDEDKIDEQGRRFQPYFKPDWNPDLLLAQNYLCHLTMIDARLVRAAGGFRPGFEGSQDHDLVLRCTAGLHPDQIHHVPRILYHWRAIPGSTALTRNAKDYAADAGARAVADHLRRTAPGATVEPLAHGHYRARWPLPTPLPKVSVVIPTRDRADLLRKCVDSVLQGTDYDNLECLVVDNQSREPDALEYLAELERRPRARVLRDDAPFNYARINNRAVSRSDGEVLCLLNNDIEAIDAGWLREMVSLAVRPGTGAVGAMLLYPDGSIQHAGVVLGLGGVANHLYAHQPALHPGHGTRVLVAQNLSAVTGACMVLRRDAFERVGGLDERLAVAFNDIDFCLRLQATGLRNAWTPFARLYHHESASRGADDTDEKQARFLAEVALMQARWGPVLAADPAYNPNLSLSGVDSALAFPPRVTAWAGEGGGGARVAPDNQTHAGTSGP